MGLSIARDDIGGTLRGRRRDLVVMGLGYEATTWIDRAPQVARGPSRAYRVSVPRERPFRVRQLAKREHQV